MSVGATTRPAAGGAPRPPAREPTPVAPARRCAYAVLRRVFEREAYTDRALHSESRTLGHRDRALAMRLAFGAVQRRATLDHVIEHLAGRGAGRLDPPVLAALRLGTYELLFLAGAPDRAVVDDAVQLAKEAGRGHGLVNAVLRRAAREGRGLLAQMDDATAEGAAARHSHPPWLAEMWWQALGAQEARALMVADNEPAELALRANALVCSSEELASRLAVDVRVGPWPPEAVVVEGPLDAHGTPEWRDGAYMPQSRAAMLVARALAPRPGERVLDLCAAPGAKTTHLAALMEDRGEILAVERHPGRAAALQRTCRRMQVNCVRVIVADALESLPGLPLFDRVLLDPPCSGLGTLQARPDLRWRVSPERVREMASEQASLLARAAAAVRPGGTLVYSTCTISAQENEHQIGALLRNRTDFEVEDLSFEWPHLRHPAQRRMLLTLPHRDATAGFFVARLRRKHADGTGA